MYDLDIRYDALHSDSEIICGQSARIVDIGHDHALKQPLEQMERSAVLVGEHAGDERLVAVGIIAAHRFGKGGDTVCVMRSVEDDDGIVAQLLETRRMLHAPQPFANTFRGDAQIVLVLQGFDRPEHTAQVVDLMSSQKRQMIGLAVIDEVGAVFIGSQRFQAYVLGAIEGVVLSAHDVLDDRVCLLTLSGDDRRAVRLDDACLLGGDLLDRVAEDGGVVEVDACDDGAQGKGDEVGRIQQSAHADLAHDDITAIAFENPKPQRCEELELGDDHAVIVELFEDGSEVGDRFGELVFAYHLVVDLDTLAKIDDIGRDEQPDLITGFLEYRAEHRADGALAVGAGYVDEALVQRGGDFVEELFHPVQPGARAESVERVDEAQAFFIIHKRHTSSL